MRMLQQELVAGVMSLSSGLQGVHWRAAIKATGTGFGGCGRPASLAVASLCAPALSELVQLLHPPLAGFPPSGVNTQFNTSALAHFRRSSTACGFFRWLVFTQLTMRMFTNTN